MKNFHYKDFSGIEGSLYEYIDRNKLLHVLDSIQNN